MKLSTPLKLAMISATISSAYGNSPPSPGKRTMDPSPGKKRGKMTMGPSPGKKSMGPSPGKRTMGPSPGKKSMGPSPGRSPGGKKVSPRSAGNSTNTRKERWLNGISADEPAKSEDYKVCDRVLPPGSFGYTKEQRQMCLEYESLPLIVPSDCSPENEVVPRIRHTVGNNSNQSYHQLAITSANPSFMHRHYSDESAQVYIRDKCGNVAADAYSCLLPPAYRADLFRFCALYTEGGVYLDSDIVPVVSLDELYSKCSIATIGYDFPQGHHQGKQMKILAAAPGAPIFKCVLETIINNVKTRYLPDTSLGVSGPSVLHKCYEQHPHGVAITYHDTRAAGWPFTGMRAGEKILALEIPGEKIFKGQRGEDDDSDYAFAFEQRKVYHKTCSLPIECSSTLVSSQKMFPTDEVIAICSSNDLVRFGYDKTGDLSLWHRDIKVWSANIKGMDSYLYMQSDGNLVAYNATTKSDVWSTGTGGNTGSIFTVENDGQARVRLGDRVLWCTNAKTAEPSPPPQEPLLKAEWEWSKTSPMGTPATATSNAGGFFNNNHLYLETLLLLSLFLYQY